MKEASWDRAASRYDDEIFDTFANDRNRVVTATLNGLISPHHTVCDFGCGVGRSVPFLAARARRVWAVDFSALSLEVAKAANDRPQNVQFLKRDLARKVRSFCAADVGLLMQVLIMPELPARQGILASVVRNLRPGGHVLAVVPSLEVALLTYRRIIQWLIREGSDPRDAVSEAADYAQDEVVSLVEGIVKIGETPTKHYLQEEVTMMFQDAGFDVLSVQKVEYSWQADFENAPKWMQEPHPWDWMLIARKR